MSEEQPSLFNTRAYKGSKAQNYTVAPPTAAMTVTATLPAYHAYLSSAGYSQYTPDDFTADVKRFGQYTGSKALSELQTTDLQAWIGELKKTMPPKTVSRKVAALGNYFRWLDKEQVLAKNPGKGLRAARVTSPLPDLLFDNEVDKLLAAASTDPRTYLVVLLLLETGLKNAELFDLDVANFDFSNKYQPELLVKHSGKQVFKDRRLTLPVAIVPVFDDYVRQYGIEGALFPYTRRFITKLISKAAADAGIKKQVSASTLRDVFVVRSVKQGTKLEVVFEKIGLAKNSYDDARKKYGRLTREAL